MSPTDLPVFVSLALGLGYAAKPGFHVCSEDLIYVLILTGQARNQLSHLPALSLLMFPEDELNEFGFSLK